MSGFNVAVNQMVGPVGAHSIQIHHESPNDLYFLKVNPPKQGQHSNQNKGHLGYRYIYIYINTYFMLENWVDFAGNVLATPWLVRQNIAT